MSRRYYCPVDGCNARFPRARELEQHKREKHNRGLDEFAEGSQ